MQSDHLSMVNNAISVGVLPTKEEAPIMIVSGEQTVPIAVEVTKSFQIGVRSIDIAFEGKLISIGYEAILVMIIN